MGAAKWFGLQGGQKRDGGMWNPRHAGPFDTVLRSGLYADMARRGRPVAERIEIGDRFGDVVVTGWVPRQEGRGKRLDVLVKCDCGAPEEIKRRSDFRNARFLGCTVCARLAFAGVWEARSWRYIVADSKLRLKLLSAISGAVARCTDPKHKHFASYGGRGIKVHTAWITDRCSYLEYVVTLDGWDDFGLELDRIDNDGHYEPGNIQFATRKHQTANRRKVQDFEAIRVGLRSIGLWPAEPLYDTYAYGALSFGS